MLDLLRPVDKTYSWFLEREVGRSRIPKHIGMIMDGNRRLAQRRGLNPWDGHRLGAEKLESILDWCFQIGIQTVTAYAFSTENFSRPQQEVEALFALFCEYFVKVADMEMVHTKGVRIKAIGRVTSMPGQVREAIAYAEARTQEYENYHLNLAVAYGGRQEVVDAIQKIAVAVEERRLEIGQITEDTISTHLYTNGHQDPDLIIRTSGEERLSGFFLWQSAYAELYFCDVFWPGFRKRDLLRAIRAYQLRKRRFRQ